ncbi:uncharacterized protein LOC131634514 [Vicia villosa]|uniref:uncharacterized protein LOC131634514 n=1 Tax=Vicia villosa TaxID=3911 RepID=UPI00273CEA35|nr:uncharacterized protein LOC131634514 [Vicia villosa]
MHCYQGNYGEDIIEWKTQSGVPITTIVTDDQVAVDKHIISRFQFPTKGSKHETRVFGFDTEWVVHEHEVSSAKCASVQLCYGNSCLIILLRFGRVPQSLVNFLHNPDYTFVGFGIKDNIAKLEKNYGFGCRNAVELAPMAATMMKIPRLSYCGVRELAYLVNGLDLRNHSCESSSSLDWSVFDHRKEIVKIASANVYAYHKIGSKLLAQDGNK